MPKYYFFPHVPLEACTPANADKHNHTALATERPELIQSLSRGPQLDPLLASVRGYSRFVIEPGQGRWYVLEYLGIGHTFLFVRVEEGQERFFQQQLGQYLHWEVKTFEEAEQYFGHTNRSSHTGVGYLMRRHWLWQEPEVQERLNEACRACPGYCCVFPAPRQRIGEYTDSWMQEHAKPVPGQEDYLCDLWKDGMCTDYENRPPVCREFMCNVVDGKSEFHDRKEFQWLRDKASCRGSTEDRDGQEDEHSRQGD